MFAHTGAGDCCTSGRVRADDRAYNSVMSGTAPEDRDPVVEVYKRDIDRTLIRENLKLTVEERFRKAMALMRFAEELRRAGREARSNQP